jgi:protein phosphatase
VPQTPTETPTAGEQPAPAPPLVCQACQAPRTAEQTYCESCGWIFPASSDLVPVQPIESSNSRILERYELGLCLGGENRRRYRGFDHGNGAADPVPVIVLHQSRACAESSALNVPEAVATATVAIEPQAEQSNSALLTTEVVPLAPVWPSLAWEQSLLEKINHPFFPRILDHEEQGNGDWLVEELPTGRLLWDAWDDPDTTAELRFDWLRQIAEGLHELHQQGAILEGLRPDIVVVTPQGQARLTDVSDLLPLPMPDGAPVRATYYSAPELVLAPEQVDARADLYSFGAMVYALHLGRELTELDFELQGVPKSIIQRFPDIHPLFARLVSKTFCRLPASRFPTDEAAREDPTGFLELIRTLEICRATLGQVRLEISAWTTTGMVRSGNEDAFAFLQAVQGHENEQRDAALVFLADGMGGSEAGEVAAALALQAMRSSLLQHPLFRAFGASPVPAERNPSEDGPSADALDADVCKLALLAALKEANKRVYDASRSRPGRQGMGCTAELVYLDGRSVYVGHIGDSRTYHLQDGRLNQLTHDQTWVNRMVAIGALTPEEAEQHPRRSELQQAVGGHPDVDPALYHARLKPGDWVVVCSDGVSNHVAPDTLKEMLQSSTSAESAARRLVNYVNLQGATDNATVVVVRAT